MKVPASLESFKEKVLLRQSLCDKRQQLAKHIQKGSSFFQQQQEELDPEKLKQGAQLLFSYAQQMMEIDQEIFELDTVLVSYLEGEFLDSLIYIHTRESQNEAGDVILNHTFSFLPEIYREEEQASVSEDDLWFLKIIKSAFSIKGIDLQKKELPPV